MNLLNYLIAISGILLSTNLVFAEENAQQTEEQLITNIYNISQTVVRISLAKGITPDDAAEAMVSKASELNLKLVGRQQVHKELEARGLNPPHIEILQFCDPEDAMKMVQLDPLYSAYMPCRISLVEDNDGKAWVYMLNLDMLINSNSLSPELQSIAIRINQNMLAILTSGATGDF